MTEFPQAQIPKALGSRPDAPRRNRFLRTVVALMLREMGSRYGRSPGGYLWAIAEPLGMILLLSVGFSLVIRTPALGNSFLLFYATGYLAFQMYQITQNTIANALKFSRSLLVYPGVSWFDAVAARFVLNAVTHLLVSYILMAGILSVIDSPVVLDFGAIIAAYVLAALLGIGVGLVNCVLFGLFPVWRSIFKMFTRPLFLASGIILLYESMPPLAQRILWWNPLLHITGRAREGFYPMYRADYVSVVYVLGWGLVLTALGLLLMRRYHAEALANQ